MYPGFVLTRLAMLLGLAMAVGLSVPSCKGDEETPVDAPVNTIDAPANLCMGGTVAYLGACTDAAQCGSCTCQAFGHGSICTVTCDGPEDCPAPSAGCSSGGYCRP